MITIRSYRLSDEPALRQVLDCVCLESRMMETRRFQPTPAWERALRFPGDPRCCLLLACADRRPVGWVRLFPLEETGGAGGALELGIGLLASYRGHRTGTALMRCALDWAREHGAPEVRLWTHVENTTAQRLFRRFHFETVRQVGDRMEMVLPLGSRDSRGAGVFQEGTYR